jgi:hypothetical protein
VRRALPRARRGRDQRLRHVASSECPKAIRRDLRHSTSHARTAEANARICSGSLTPGDRSTPDLRHPARPGAPPAPHCRDADPQRGQRGRPRADARLPARAPPSRGAHQFHPAFLPPPCPTPPRQHLLHTAIGSTALREAPGAVCATGQISPWKRARNATRMSWCTPAVNCSTSSATRSAVSSISWSACAPKTPTRRTPEPVRGRSTSAAWAGVCTRGPAGKDHPGVRRPQRRELRRILSTRQPAELDLNHARLAALRRARAPWSPDRRRRQGGTTSTASAPTAAARRTPSTSAMPLSYIAMRSGGTNGITRAPTSGSNHQGLQIAIVHADHCTRDRQGARQLGLVAHLDEGVRPIATAAAARSIEFRGSQRARNQQGRRRTDTRAPPAAVLPS